MDAVSAKIATADSLQESSDADSSEQRSTPQDDELREVYSDDGGKSFEYFHQLSRVPMDEIDNIDEYTDDAIPEPQGEYSHEVPVNSHVARIRFSCPCCEEETEVRVFYPFLPNELFEAPCCETQLNLNPDVTLTSFTIVGTVAPRRQRYEQVLAELDSKGVTAKRSWSSGYLTERNDVFRRQGETIHFIDDLKSSFSLRSPPTGKEASLARLHNMDFYVMWSLFSVTTYPGALGIGVDSSVATLVMCAGLLLAVGTLLYDGYVIRGEVDESEYDISLIDVVAVSPTDLYPVSFRVINRIVTGLIPQVVRTKIEQIGKS